MYTLILLYSFRKINICNKVYTKPSKYNHVAYGRCIRILSMTLLFINASYRTATSMKAFAFFFNLQRIFSFASAIGDRIWSSFIVHQEIAERRYLLFHCQLSRIYAGARCSCKILRSKRPSIFKQILPLISRTFHFQASPSISSKSFHFKKDIPFQASLPF